MPENETAEFRPVPPRASSTPWIIAAVLACAVGAGAAWWFWLRPVEAPGAPPPVARAAGLPTGRRTASWPWMTDTSSLTAPIDTLMAGPPN